MGPPGRPVFRGALEARAGAFAIHGCTGRLASCERERKMAEQPFPWMGNGGRPRRTHARHLAGPSEPAYVKTTLELRPQSKAGSQTRRRILRK